MDNYTPENLNRWTSADPAFGSTDNYAGADLSEFYVAPISITRDTADSVTLSNWKVGTESLDSLIKHDESGEHTFNHWACGWYAIYLIHETDTAALKAADEMAVSLSDYPILDEMACSELEFEAESEAWESWGRREFRDIVTKELAEYAPQTASAYWEDDIMEYVTDEALDNLWRTIADSLSWVCEHYSDGPRFNFDACDGWLSCAVLADLTGLPLLPPSQEWRREPYPWPGADPSPLAPSLSPQAEG